MGKFHVIVITNPLESSSCYLLT